MSKFALAYGMKKKMKKECHGGEYAKGGEVGIHKQDEHRMEGTSEAGHYAKYQASAGNSDGSKDWTNKKAKEKHHQVISEMRSMPKPNLPMAEGGMIHDEEQSGYEHADLVARIMKHRQMAEGGVVANDTHPFEAEFHEPNEFDDLVLDDHLEGHNSGAADGDELGNKQEDEDRHDIVAKIMKSRGKKDRNPRPA